MKKNWFARHKFLTAIMVLVILAVLGSSIEDSGGVDSAVASKITKENCDLVKSGMSSEEVIATLGEPKSKSETEIDGIGKTEYWHYQKGISLQACAITLLNGKVSSKTWTDL